jgi:S1-C subfamily serine protease
MPVPSLAVEEIRHRIDCDPGSLGVALSGRDGPAVVGGIRPNSIGSKLNLSFSDEITEVNGVRITGGGQQAQSLLLQSHGPVDLKVRRASVDLNSTRSAPDEGSTASSSSPPDSPAERARGSWSSWGEPTRVAIDRARGEHLGITCTQHAPHPGVLISRLEPRSICLGSGLTVGSALISVAGKEVHSHEQAIELLEQACRTVTSKGTFSGQFEVVVRHPSRGSQRVVQSL